MLGACWGLNINKQSFCIQPSPPIQKRHSQNTSPNHHSLAPVFLQLPDKQQDCNDELFVSHSVVIIRFYNDKVLKPFAKLKSYNNHKLWGHFQRKKKKCDLFDSTELQIVPQVLLKWNASSCEGKGKNYQRKHEEMRGGNGGHYQTAPIRMHWNGPSVGQAANEL